MNITEFLEARIAEDEHAATPRTIVISGGWPAPEVPNCVGPEGRGCPDGRWQINPPADAARGWYKSEEPRALIKAHEMTHVSTQQKRVLAECAAKRAMVQLLGPALNAPLYQVERALAESALRHLAAVYADHPDYRQDWEL